MKKRLVSGVIIFGALLMPLLPAQLVHADETTELQTVSKDVKQSQNDVDKQVSAQLTFDQKETPKPSDAELKKISKLKISDFKNKRTKKIKYHKRNVDKVNKTLPKYH